MAFAAPDKPNILLIIADDVGFSNLPLLWRI
jgi:arylsulfatase A-like enzyme